jgi:hypothetical protein
MVREMKQPKKLEVEQAQDHPMTCKDLAYVLKVAFQISEENEVSGKKLS